MADPRSSLSIQINTIANYLRVKVKDRYELNVPTMDSLAQTIMNNLVILASIAESSYNVVFCDFEFVSGYVYNDGKVVAILKRIVPASDREENYYVVWYSMESKYLGRLARNVSLDKAKEILK